MIHENVEHSVDNIIQQKNKYVAKLKTEISSATKKSSFFCSLKLLVPREVAYWSVSEP
jgi:hypothetical protein